MALKIYNYSRLTGEYFGQGVADIDPVASTPTEQVYLPPPAFATTVAPPAPVAGKKAVFDATSETWSQQEDSRGTVYNTTTGQPEQWDKLGALPSTLTKLKPAPMQTWNATAGAWVDDLALHQADKNNSLKVEYQTLLDAGVIYNGALFQSDAKSITTLAEVLTAVANGWALPAVFAWIDAANTAHPATIAFLKAISTAFANHKAALFSRLFIAKNKINQANTIKAVNAVVL